MVTGCCCSIHASCSSSSRTGTLGSGSGSEIGTQVDAAAAAHVVKTATAQESGGRRCRLKERHNKLGVGVGSKAGDTATAQVHKAGGARCWVKYETEGYTDQDNAEKSYFERSKKISYISVLH